MNLDERECKAMRDRLGALEWWTLHASIWIQEVIDEAQHASADPEGATEREDGRELLEWLDWIITGETDHEHTPEQSSR